MTREEKDRAVDEVLARYEHLGRHDRATTIRRSVPPPADARVLRAPTGTSASISAPSSPPEATPPRQSGGCGDRRPEAPAIGRTGEDAPVWDRRGLALRLSCSRTSAESTRSNAVGERAGRAERRAGQQLLQGLRLGELRPVRPFGDHRLVGGGQVDHDHAARRRRAARRSVSAGRRAMRAQLAAHPGRARGRRPGRGARWRSAGGAS